MVLKGVPRSRIDKRTRRLSQALTQFELLLGDGLAIDGNGQLEVDDLSGDYVPYTGATANVDLGAFNLTTTGSLTGGLLSIDNITINGAAITSDTGAISLDNESLTTTGSITGGSLTIDSITIDGAAITSDTGTINFGDDNLTTNGTITATGVLIDANGTLQVTGTTALNDHVTIGVGSPATDYTLTFDGDSSDGVVTWDENNARFDFSIAGSGPGSAGLDAGNGAFTSLTINGNLSISGYKIDSPNNLTVEATSLYINGTSNTFLSPFGGDTWFYTGIRYDHSESGIRLHDNYSIYFGTSLDAKIWYDSVNLRIDSRNLGTGRVFVDAPIIARNITTYSPTTDAYQIHAFMEPSAATDSYLSCLLGEFFADPPSSGTQSGWWNALAGVLRYRSAYNVSTSWAQGVSMIGVVGGLSFNQAGASGDCDAAACFMTVCAENGAAGYFTGTLDTLYFFRSGNFGTGANPIDVTHVYGLSIGELDGHSNAVDCYGVHVGPVSGATGDNHAIHTSGGGHYLDDWAYIGDVVGGNYTEIESDGTIECHGDATVWNDANVGAAQLSLPASGQPDEDEFVDEGGSDTGITTWAFGVGEKISGELEIPHDYKEGSDLYFHVHWQGIAAPAGGTDNVQWQLTYTIAQTGQTLDAAATITFESAITTQYTFILSAFAAITGTNFNIGDQFLFTLERIAATSDEYGGDALLATVGIHYECDTLGSRQITTK